MLSKNTITHINKLSLKKFRDQEHMFIAEGVKLVHEFLKSSFQVLHVFAVSEIFQKEVLKQNSQCEFQLISENEMQRISQLKNASTVLAVIKMPDFVLNAELLKGELTLMLDNIQDPGNLGTIIRTADWYGIKNIICSENTVDVYNPKVVQATMGSLTRVRVFYSNIAEILTAAKQFEIPVYGAFLNGENIYEHSLGASGIVVMGNEGNGISDDVVNLINQKLYIPSFQNESDVAESLNVAVATAVICSEFRRRKF